MSKKMIGGLMKQAQKLQEEMARIQAEAAQRTAEGTAGGGMVTATANGANELVSIRIEKDVINPEDPEMLQDLVVAAVNGALRKAQEDMQQEMSRFTGGLNLPGLGDLGGMFGR